jgi:hypothetical protein
MKHPSRATPTHADPPTPSAALSALAVLLEAGQCARHLGQESREFAVELPCLLAAGITPGAIRWLMHSGYAEHLVETTPPKSGKRSFREAAGTALGASSCFVLTDVGTALALRGAGPAAPAAKPTWDQDHRELCLGPFVVKRFTQAARVQETILAAFEEEGWPDRIDDPIPPSADLDPVNRLRSAVNNLNRGQRPPHVRFGVCNCGSAVSWRVASE